MMEQSEYLSKALNTALTEVKGLRHEFVTPEHVLQALLYQAPFCKAFCDMAGADKDTAEDLLYEFKNKLDIVPLDIEEYDIMLSEQMSQALSWAYHSAESSSRDVVEVPHLVNAFLHLPDSLAAGILENSIECSKTDFLSYLIEVYEEAEGNNGSFTLNGEDESEEQASPWRRFVVCMNDRLGEQNPLIGREQEIERTIQVLCRLEKNNPLHVGESGVGKTALVWGLTARIQSGNVPARLKDFKVYQLDLAGMLAGASYRGEFEKRLKSVMDGIQAEGRSIVYIDEVHNLVGAGQMEGSMDACQILLPYMANGELRFIGSTTYQDLNRHMTKQRALMRRFQQIDISEPSVEETIEILHGLKDRYQKYHHVTYAKGVLEHAARMSAQYISNRFLPDKAIDLLDEAGAWRELHPTGKKRETVDKQLLNDVLGRICKVDAAVLREEGNDNLKTLAKRIQSKIYGQDEAIRRVVNAVEMAKAGLLDEDKPMASLLFVGPTGVGKTEVCRVLAQELGIELVRFDMSEYTEKHTVAKLIGSPAGYVGYEDGGLLTDAIRKTPNCVLLLDEIEKAHSDIYNILLQVMDYARLTDSHGNKADFRHVILVMTSNAGAQYASQAQLGFGGGSTAGQAMLNQVKKTFKPEFLNRLSGTVVFNDMDQAMASLILDKKLAQLQDKLTARKVTLTLTPDARQTLLEKGFTRQYGAREMDRVIQQMLTPVLMREILYGKLKKGGNITIDKDGLLA